jgi:hypothetical protein
MTACILVCEPAWSNQELEPARSATLSSGLYAAKEVTFGEDTDETPVTVGNRQTTDTALQHYANGSGKASASEHVLVCPIASLMVQLTETCWTLSAQSWLGLNTTLRARCNA